MLNNQRKSGLELLRIIGMLLIVMSHTYGIFRIQELGQEKYFIYYFLITFGSIGNLIYIFISNYYLTLEENNTVKNKKIWSLLIDQFIICILTILLSYLFGGAYKWTEIVRQVLSPAYGTYWFITAYILYYILHPALNIIIKALDYKTYCIYGLIFGFVFFILPCIPDTCSPTATYFDNSLYFIAFHMVFGFFRKFNPNIFKKNVMTVPNIIISLFVLVISIFIFFYFSQLSGYDFWLRWNFLGYLPLCFFVFSLFIYFLNLNFKSNIINSISKYMLLVYLVHYNYAYRKYGPLIIKDEMDGLDIYKRIVFALIFSMIYFIFSLLIGVLYSGTKRLIISIFNNIKQMYLKGE